MIGRRDGDYMFDLFRPQIAEVINRNKFTNLALEQGYNVYLPVYDRGVDFIVYHEKNEILIKVQLKSRWTIDRKYLEKGISIAFPIGNDWYLMPHDRMVELEEPYGVRTNAWILGGSYNRIRPRRELVEAAKQYKFPFLIDK
jgi:hypothetical protein